MNESNSPVFSLDHVGFIVRDLARTAEVMQALGFVLTERAEHTRVAADGKVVSAGSAQRSLMLREGYIEFMEIFDPAAGHMLAAAPQVRHGMHILAIGTEDAHGAHELCGTRGVKTSSVMEWSRQARESGDAVLRFRFFGADWQPKDPSYLCWVQHLTPELLRPRPLLSHGNGADSLLGVGFRGGPAFLAEWARCLTAGGAEALKSNEQGLELRLGQARIALVPGNEPDPVVPEHLTLAARSLAVLHRAANSVGVESKLENGAIWLDLRQTLGMHWRCVQAES